MCALSPQLVPPSEPLPYEAPSRQRRGIYRGQLASSPNISFRNTSPSPEFESCLDGLN